MTKVMELTVDDKSEVKQEITVEEKIESYNSILEALARIDKLIKDPNSYLVVNDENK